MDSYTDNDKGVWVVKVRTIGTHAGERASGGRANARS